MTKTPTIIVAGAVLREGITSILQNTRYEVIASAAGPSELAHVRLRDGQSSLLIVGTDGRNLDATAESVQLLRSSISDGKLMLIVETDGGIHLSRALALSPDGCIVNPGSPDTLVKILELIFMDQQVFAIERFIAKTAFEPAARTVSDKDGVANGVASQSHESNALLSPRERQVLLSIAQGKSNKVIARQHNLAESTVKVHLKAVLRKLGKQNRTQAAIWAIKHGLSGEFSEHGSIVPEAPSLTPGRQR